MLARTCLFVLVVLATTVPAAAQTRTITLAEAITTAEERSLDVAVAEQVVRQATALRRQALAMIRPTVTLSATYTLRDEEIELDFGNPFEPLAPFLDTVYAEHAATNPNLFDPALLYGAESEPQVVQYRHDVMGSLAIDQSLYNARALPYIRQARIGIRQAEHASELVAYQLRGAVTETYFAAVLQQRLVEVSARSAELARIAHEAAVAAYEADVGNRFEVNRTQVELSSAERAVENAQTAYLAAIRNLGTLLDVAPDFDVVAPAVIDVPRESPTVPDDAPELVAHDLEIERQAERISEARAQWFPTLFAHGQANLQRESAFGGDQFSWYVQIGANWVLYDGSVRSAQRRAREQEQIAEELRQERTLNQLEAAIDLSVLRVEQLERDIESARADVELARENVELTEAAVELGAANTLDAQVARQQLLLSELALTTAEVNLQATLYELLRIAGDTPWNTAP